MPKLPDDLPEFREADPEEFLPLVDLVHLLLDESLVQGVLQRRGIFRGEHGMHVEREGHAGVAEFPDALGRVEPPGQADLVDVLAERADVGDDVDMPALRLLGHRDRLLALLLGLDELDAQLLQLRFELRPSPPRWPPRIAS